MSVAAQRGTMATDTDTYLAYVKAWALMRIKIGVLCLIAVAAGQLTTVLQLL